MNLKSKGLIFDIQGYAVHDGPGCRTLVFLSGCPLRCYWCSNPEGQVLHRRLMHQVSRCFPSSFNCVKSCPQNAVQKSKGETSSAIFTREICDRCEVFACVQTCFKGALKIAGRYYSVPELMKIFQRDRNYWGKNGGVTFSGGEPLYQEEFIRAILEECRNSYIHTAIETSGHVNAIFFMEVVEGVDWIFFDIKHIEEKAHKKATGLDNRLILKNIENLSASNWPGRLIVRLTIVPGFNDSIENFYSTAQFMKKISLDEINILSFHRLGHSKYSQLHLPDKSDRLAPPKKEEMISYRQFFEEQGLRCYIDSDTPF